MIRTTAAFIGDRARLYGILRAEWSDAPPETPLGESMRRYLEMASSTDAFEDEMARVILAFLSY